jgi:hypothetical protein
MLLLISYVVVVDISRMGLPAICWLNSANLVHDLEAVEAFD